MLQQKYKFKELLTATH